MKLTTQLLLLSSILLLLPWAIFETVSELNHTLAQAQRDNLQTKADIIAKSIGQHYRQLLNSSTNDNHSFGLYFHEISQPNSVSIKIDGRSDDWPEESLAPSNKRFLKTDNWGFEYRAIKHQDRLFLLLDIHDIEHDVFELSQEPFLYEHRLEILLGQRHFVFYGAGQDTISQTSRVLNLGTPKAISNKQLRDTPKRLSSSAQIQAYGYRLEMEIPLAAARYGIAIKLVSRGQSIGNWPNNKSFAGAIRLQSNQLNQALTIFDTPGQEIQVLDAHQDLLASAGQLNDIKANKPDRHWLLEWLYRQIFDIEQLQDTLIVTAPIHNNTNLENPTSIAQIRLRENYNRYARISSSTLSNLFSVLFSVIAILFVAIFSYAAWLSWRIRKLSQASRRVMTDRNIDLEKFPKSSAEDEIGALSRDYRQLLGQIAQYHDYLTTLSGKLSHELRTPIAIIRSSLGNLRTAQNELASDDMHTYLSRASEGTERLARILNAMSEASHLEESLEDAEIRRINIVSFITDLCQSYQQLHAPLPINLSLQGCTKASNTEATLAPDLIVQMLDKLVDNAVSFATPLSKVEIKLDLGVHKDHFTLKVINQGPLLPESMQEHLFDNMVSLRKADAGNTHLGLGLFIVRLIVEFHQGSIHANNLDDRSGVEFEIQLPLNAKL